MTAPVTDRRGRLVGRVTLDAVLDFTRQRAAERSRRTWLAVNLVTACVASRVISVFEGTIEKWSRSPR